LRREIAMTTNRFLIAILVCLALAWVAGFFTARMVEACGLSPGWNLIATQEDTAPAELAAADECIQSIWLWNPVTQEWNAWFPLADGMVGAADLYEVPAGLAYWVWCER
jgi:hypothetical protein